MKKKRHLHKIILAQLSVMTKNENLIPAMTYFDNIYNIITLELQSNLFICLFNVATFKFFLVYHYFSVYIPHSSVPQFIASGIC